MRINGMDKSTVLVLTLLQLVVLVASQSPIGTPISSPSLSPVSPVPLPPIIDTHTHYVPPFYKALLASRNISSGGRSIPDWNATAHLAVNDLLGIVTSVVAVSTPGVVFSPTTPVNESRPLARLVNEFGYNLTQEYPKKFLFWATLTLPDVEGSVAEAIYALDTLGAAGVIIEASVFGELLGTPRWAPLYQVLDDRKAVVFVHPSNSPCAVQPTFLPNSTDIPSFVVDFLLDTSRAALNLVYRNVTTDYPNITFLLAHSGGFLPFAAVREAGGLALLSNNPGGPAYFLGKLQQFHADLAISASQYALPSTTAFFNSTKLTYGTDYPFAPVRGIQGNQGVLLTYPLSRAARKRIEFGNAHRLFKKFLK